MYFVAKLKEQNLHKTCNIIIIKIMKKNNFKDFWIIIMKNKILIIIKISLIIKMIMRKKKNNKDYWLIIIIIINKINNYDEKLDTFLTKIIIKISFKE